MPFSDAQNKTQRHQLIQLLFWRNRSRRFRTGEIATILGVSEDTALKDLNELSRPGGPLPITKEKWDWYLPADARFDLFPLTLTLEEATALYLAGRLLSQIHDERNQHVMSALIKLIGAMPEDLAPHQQKIVEMAQERQREQPDRSQIFQAIAQGWARYCVLRVVYAPPHKKTFECQFSPYIVEPSGIGRTIYAIGYSVPPNGLRTYKLERIQHVEVTGIPFEVPADFDGPALLKNAWGVMYGDEEPVAVRLRFSHYVTKRIKETLWHPSQQIQDTPEGCEWSAQIGDTLEIENWIRGWGSDCEVLAPVELREKMVKEVRRLAHMYGVTAPTSSSPDEPDMGLLSNIFGG